MGEDVADMKKYLLLILCLWLPFFGVAQAQEKVTIKIQGSTTVNPVVAEAAEVLRSEKGWQIFVDTQGGSSGGI